MQNNIGFYNLPLLENEKENIALVCSEEILQTMQKRVYDKLLKDISLTDSEKLQFSLILKSEGVEKFSQLCVKQMNEKMSTGLNKILSSLINKDDISILSKIGINIRYSYRNFEIDKNEYFIKLKYGLLYQSEPTKGLIDLSPLFDQLEMDEILVNAMNEKVYLYLQDGNETIYYRQIERILNLMNAENILDNVIKISNTMKRF